MKARVPLVVGALLIALGLFARGRLGPTVEDSALAEAPLARLPLSSIAPQGTVFLLSVPTGDQWNRIRGEWGDPGIMVFAAGPGTATLEWSSLGVGVEVSGRGGPVAIEPTGRVPFGRDSLSTDGSSGLILHGHPGDDLLVRVSSTGQVPQSSGVLVFKYEWGRGPGKDHAIAPPVEAIIGAVATASIIVGVAAAAFGMALSLRQSRGRSQQRTA